MKSITCPECNGEKNFFVRLEASFDNRNMEIYGKEVYETCRCCEGVGKLCVNDICIESLLESIEMAYGDNRRHIKENAEKSKEIIRELFESFKK
jgi:hypothetical protein